MALDGRKPLPSRLERTQPKDLAAGRMRVRFDPVGELRHLEVAGHEVVNRIYFAVRDKHWGTVPGELISCQVAMDDQCFCLDFDVRHQSGDIQFCWHGKITGGAEWISFVVEGRAESGFLYNRIGLCILYPSDVYAGSPYRIRGVDGGERTGVFPEQIEPQRIEEGHLVAAIGDICSMGVDLPAVSVKCEFTGDIFEIEDQRNWTDNSYKAYSTPIHLPYPRTASPGEEFRQEVRIWMRAAERDPQYAFEPGAVRLEIGTPLAEESASVGFGLQHPFSGFTEDEEQALETLRPHHLRYEVQPWEEGWGQRLAAFLRSCSALSCEAEVAMYLTHAEEHQINDLSGVLRLVPTPTRLLMFHVDEEVTDPRWLELVRQQTRDLASVVSVGGGTELHFCEINRHHAFAKSSGSVYYSITPQVHAFDEESILETLEAQRQTVRSTRAFVVDTHIGIAPVTLHQRAPAKRRMLGTAVADAADPRQQSLFTAAWTVGSLHYLQDSGASTLTYFAVSGLGGLIQGGGSGCVYPVYHVFADYVTMRAGEILAVTSSDRRHALGIAAKVDGSVCALVANVSAEVRTVEIGPFVAHRLWARILEAGNVPEAMRDPAEFRSRLTLLSVGDDGRGSIVLGPYACAYVAEDS